MQSGVYNTQEDCERRIGESKKELCIANKDIIEKSLIQDELFCNLCSTKYNSDMNICLALLKAWQTLHIIR